MHAATGMTRLHYESDLYYGGIALLQAVSQHLDQQQRTHTLSDNERLLMGKLLAEEGGIWSSLNKYEESKRALEHASAILHEDDDPGVLALIAYQAGRIALHQNGRGDMAIGHFEKGLAYAQRGNNLDIEVMILRDIGSVYRQRGDYVTFIEYLEQCLHLVRKIQDSRKEMAFLYFLGYYKVETGEYWQGREMLLAAQALNERAIDSAYHRGAISSSLGHIADRLGRPVYALTLFHPSMVELKGVNEKWRLTMACVELASAQMQVEGFDDARSTLRQGEQIAQKHNLTELQAHVTLARAYLDYYSKRFADATRLFADAQQRMGSLKRPIGVIESQVMQASCALERGDIDAAQRVLGDSLEYVARERLDGAYQRERLYSVAYQVALALEPDMAEPILQAAHAFVTAVVDGVKEEEWRASYLARTAVQSLAVVQPPEVVPLVEIMGRLRPRSPRSAAGGSSRPRLAAAPAPE